VQLTSRAYHVAFLVGDIYEAAPRYAAALGVSFLPIEERTIPCVRQRTGDGPFATKATYSIAGPMFVELLQAFGNGLWAPREVDTVHHIGVWSDDVGTRSRELADQGYEWDGELVEPDGSALVAFWRSGDVRFELVSESRRQIFEQYVNGTLQGPYYQPGAVPPGTE
jgi:hypothetical protein